MNKDVTFDKVLLTWVISIDLCQVGVEAEGVVSPVSASRAADVVTTSCLTLRLTICRIVGQYSGHVTSIDQ